MLEHALTCVSRMRVTRRYVHPLSAFMRLWEAGVILPICAYFLLVVPVRACAPHTSSPPHILLPRRPAEAP